MLLEVFSRSILQDKGESKVGMLVWRGGGQGLAWSPAWSGEKVAGEVCDCACLFTLCTGRNGEPTALSS